MLLQPLEKLFADNIFPVSFASRSAFFFIHRFSHDINEIKIAAEEGESDGRNCNFHEKYYFMPDF